MVRPVLKYGSSVWDPHSDKLQEELEKIQSHAASLVTRNYVYETWSMTGILGQLKWESLKKRRKDNRIILLYKGLKGKARIPILEFLGETRIIIIIIIIQIIIISAGTHLVSNSFYFSWNPKYIELWDQYILVSS